MPRQTKTTEIATVKMNHDAVREAGQAFNTMSKQATAIMEAYNIRTTNKDALVAEIRGHMSTAVEVMFYIGARLMLLKSLCDHGEYLPLLEQIGLSPRTAQRVMQATITFADPKTLKARDRFIDLDRGKMIELLVLDGEQIDQLEKGELLELDLDDVSRMSPTELRRKVRELKMANEAKDKLIEKRSKENDKLQEQLSGAFIPQPGSVAQTEFEQSQYLGLIEAHTELIAAQSRLAVVCRDIRDNSPGVAMTDAAEAALKHAAQRLAEMLQEGGIDVDFAEMITPAWLDADALKASAKAKAKK